MITIMIKAPPPRERCPPKVHAQVLQVDGGAARHGRGVVPAGTRSALVLYYSILYEMMLCYIIVCCVIL